MPGGEEYCREETARALPVLAINDTDSIYGSNNMYGMNYDNGDNDMMDPEDRVKNSLPFYYTAEKGKKFKFLIKIVILLDNQNFREKSKFWAKIQILDKHRNFGRKFKL